MATCVCGQCGITVLSGNTVKIWLILFVKGPFPFCGGMSIRKSSLDDTLRHFLACLKININWSLSCCVNGLPLKNIRLSTVPRLSILGSEIHRIAEVHFESNINDSLGSGGKTPMGHWRREREKDAWGRRRERIDIVCLCIYVRNKNNITRALEQAIRTVSDRAGSSVR